MVFLRLLRGGILFKCDNPKPDIRDKNIYVVNLAVSDEIFNSFQMLAPTQD